MKNLIYKYFESLEFFQFNIAEMDIDFKSQTFFVGKFSVFNKYTYGMMEHTLSTE